MQSAFNSGRKQRRGSRAAQKAVSPKQVRRRRHAQKRRRFTSTLRSAQSFILNAGRARLGFNPRKKRKASSLPVPAGAHTTLLPGFSGLTPSKTVSLLLLAAVAAALYWLHTSESFYIYQENVRFEGAHYLTQDELFAACDIDSWSVFWLDQAKIEERVMAHPYVAGADVHIRWPGRIDVSVQEVRPVALWATDQQEFWLLEDGVALAPRASDMQPALRIIDPSAAAQTAILGGAPQIDKRILTAALYLSNRLPINSEVWYNSRYGLNFSLPSTQAWVHWGDGHKFEEKWTVLQRLMPQLETAGDEALTLNVMVPNRSFIRRYDGSPTNQ